MGPIIRSWLAFQLIYARGMFRIVADTMQEFADVSTHICVGNVSARPYLGVKASSFNSYMCEECFAYGDNTLDNAVVSTHICVGNVSLHYAGGVAAVLRVFQFIYVRGMFPGFGRFRGSGMCFNSYMCGECFQLCEFQFIYARGMFRLQAMPRLPLELFQFIYVRGMFLLSDWTYLSLQVFQFIYVRGMFPSASGIGRWSTRWFQLIYA